MNEKLNTAIKKSGYNRTEVAQKVGISRVTLYNIINEKYKPSKEIENKLLKVIEKKYEDVFEVKKLVINKKGINKKRIKKG